jgi:hypothetical protein
MQELTFWRKRMWFTQQLRLAVFIGALLEFILAAPLFIVNRYLELEVPSWVFLLEKFQAPGLPLIERLYRTHWLVQFAASFPHSRLMWLGWMGSGLVVLTQIVVFTAVAFGLISAYNLATGQSWSVRAMS